MTPEEIVKDLAVVSDLAFKPDGGGVAVAALDELVWVTVGPFGSSMNPSYVASYMDVQRDDLVASEAGSTPAEALSKLLDSMLRFAGHALRLEQSLQPKSKREVKNES